jgi:aerobic-type carbon monoxide dehydrogenase small subunit (CoxS/CutS family)
VTRVALTVNGKPVAAEVEGRTLLVQLLRETLGLTGTHVGCDTSQCGACTVIVDGRAMYSCLLLAIDCQGREIRTIEGLTQGDELDPLQEAFVANDAFQCGYCTSGQIMSLRALLDAHPHASDEQIERAVTGNLCRCGAYLNILAAGRQVAQRQANGRQSQDGRA